MYYIECSKNQQHMIHELFEFISGYYGKILHKFPFTFTISICLIKNITIQIYTCCQDIVYRFNHERRRNLI